jgi:hypothetical protein
MRQEDMGESEEACVSLMISSFLKTMLQIRFVTVGLRDLPIPNSVESPVPFKKGDKVYYKTREENRPLEVESVQWVLDYGGFYQEVSLVAANQP